MRINVLFVIAVYALFAVSQGKSVKKASTKITTKSKPSKTAKHQDVKPIHKTKPAAKKSNVKAKAKPKENENTKKTVISKPAKKVEEKAVMRTAIPNNCNEIVEEYTNGRILMAEYQAKMGRCLKTKGVEANGDTSKKAETPTSDQNSVQWEQTSAETDAAQQPETMYVAETGNHDENDNKNDQQNDKQNDAKIQHEISSDLKSESDSSYDDDDESENDDDDSDDYDDGFMRAAEKRMEVPAVSNYQDSSMTTAQQPDLPNQQSTNYYPNQAAQVEAPAPSQAQAAFAPSTFNSYQAPAQPVQQDNMMMNAVAKDDVPNAAQAQSPSMQADTVQNQWNSDAQKKNETPNAPIDQQFAQFMKMQTSSAAPAVPGVQAPSQQAATTADAQQRSDIQPSWPNIAGSDQQAPAVRSDVQANPVAPAQSLGPAVDQQRSDIQTGPNTVFDPQNASAFSVPASPQASFMVPVKRSAPEEDGDFPESP